GDPLAFEQRTVAVRAVRDAATAILALARHIHFAPPRARRDDDGTAAQGGAARELNRDQAVRVRRNELLRTLHIHEVDVVALHVLFERNGHPRAFRLLDGNEVLDRQRVEHLPTETLRDHAGADAFASGIDRRGGTCGPTANDEHVECFFLVQLLRLASARTRVELRKDLFDRRAALAEHFTIEIDRRN